jgi:hypothetical protein
VYIKIFPNPAGNYFIIEFDTKTVEENQSILIKLIDNNGKQMRVFRGNKSFDQLLVRTGNLAAGSYLCELWVGRHIKASSKVIISKQ